MLVLVSYSLSGAKYEVALHCIALFLLLLTMVNKLKTDSTASVC